MVPDPACVSLSFPVHAAVTYDSRLFNHKDLKKPRSPDHLNTECPISGEGRPGSQPPRAQPLQAHGRIPGCTWKPWTWTLNCTLGRHCGRSVCLWPAPISNPLGGRQLSPALPFETGSGLEMPWEATFRTWHLAWQMKSAGYACPSVQA